MVKVAKDLWRTFEFNLNRAKALAQSQHYLEVAVTKGEDAVQAYVQDLMTKVFALIGLDYKAMMANVMKAVEGPLTAQMEAYEKEHAEELKARSDELSKMDEKTFTKEFSELVEPFVNLGLLSEQTLREGAVVFAVAALEAFLKDVVSSEIRRRPSAIRLFPDIEKSIDLRVIRQYGGKIRAHPGEGEARKQARVPTNTVKSALKKPFGIPTTHQS